MNKNTKRLRVEVRKAGKSGQDNYSVKMPTHGYHSSDSGQFAERSVPTARRGASGVVSVNESRNTQMRVLQNADGGTLTSHEPINKSVPVRHKGHGYLIQDEHKNNQYRQLPSVR